TLTHLHSFPTRRSSDLENSGHMLNMLSRLKSENIHLYTVPIQARTNRDVWVENIMTPADVTAEELFPVEVHVYSQGETAAEVQRSEEHTSELQSRGHLV